MKGHCGTTVVHQSVPVRLCVRRPRAGIPLTRSYGEHRMIYGAEMLGASTWHTLPCCSSGRSRYEIHHPYPTKTPSRSLTSPSSPLLPIPIPLCGEVVLESENRPENTPCLRKDEVRRERGVGGCRMEKGWKHQSFSP